jgi:hypothetical protein
LPTLAEPPSLSRGALMAGFGMGKGEGAKRRQRRAKASGRLYADGGRRRPGVRVGITVSLLAGLIGVAIGVLAGPAAAISGAFVPITNSSSCPLVLATGWSDSGGTCDLTPAAQPYIYLDDTDSASYEFTVPNGETETVTYGIPANDYVNNVDATITIDGGAPVVIPDNPSNNAIGATTPTDLSLWTSSSLGPGSHTWTITSTGHATNVYGLWVLGSSSVTTGLVNDATSSAIGVGSAVPFDTNVYDTATVSGIDTPTGTVTYDLYDNGTCSDAAASSQVVAISGGSVPNSSPTGALTPGAYAFQAQYSGDTNNAGSTGSCEWFTVSMGNQTISFTSTAPSDAVVGGPTYSVSATASSGLTVALTIDSSATSVCQISGSTVSFTHAGTCVIDANQTGDSNYNAAPEVQQSFTVYSVLNPLAITTTASMIPSATEDVPYSFQLDATGGTPQYTWAVTGGALPMGLTLSPTGLLSGTPESNTGTYDFTVTVVDSGSPPQTASQPLSMVLQWPTPPPPPTKKTVTCNGSCSTTVTTSTGTETVSGTSVGIGVVEVSVETQSLACGGLDYSPQITDVVSTVTFPAGLKVATTIDKASDPKAYLTCYSDPTPFVDAAGATATIGFLPACPATITDSTGPCVISQVEKHSAVVVTLHILDGDPRFWTGRAGKTGKK